MHASRQAYLLTQISSFMQSTQDIHDIYTDVKAVDTVDILKQHQEALI